MLYDVRLYTKRYAYTYVCMYVHVQAYVVASCACVIVCAYICTLIHVYEHTYVYTESKRLKIFAFVTCSVLVAGWRVLYDYFFQSAESTGPKPNEPKLTKTNAIKN